MSEELKPCPFCGGEADPEGWMNGDGECGPECESCGATASSVIVWNRRAELAALKALSAENQRVIPAEPLLAPPHPLDVAPKAVAFEDNWPAIAAELPMHQRGSYDAEDIEHAEREGALAGWTAHANLYDAPPASADTVSVAPGLERAIQIVREVAKTQPGYSDEREAIFEALSEAYVEAMAPPCTSAAVMSVSIGLLRNICSMVPEKMKPARKELRALLARQEVKS